MCISQDMDSPDRVKTLQEEASTLRRELAEAKAALVSKTSKLRMCEAANMQLEAEVATVEESLECCMDDISAFERSEEKLREALHYGSKSYALMAKQMVSLQSNLKSKDEALKSTENQNSSLQNRVTVLEDTVRSLMMHTGWPIRKTKCRAGMMMRKKANSEFF